ncbi:MAG: tocopherol cyclase family protein [Acutalibacteraceae bacterium]
MRKSGFEGWYFKHQCGGDMLAFIPGKAESGAFVQMMSSNGSRYFEVDNIFIENGKIIAGNCELSRQGCKISLPGVSGKITYSNITPIRSDIMGPFRFFPMQCRHGVISMAHTLMGSVTIDGEQHIFDGGKGYIEKDSGRSFPRSYMWVQCNGFDDCSLMVSVASIPFCGFEFTGCICAIICGCKEYRLATYNGVHILAADAEHICLSQGKLKLEINIKPQNNGHLLRSPVKGNMSGIIRESGNAYIHARLTDGDKTVFDLQSDEAAYEFMPQKGKTSIV